MKQLFFILLMGLSFISCAGDIEVEPDAVVIDVRTLQEWNSGHLESAIFLPVDQLKDNINQVVPDKSQQVVLYCKSGVRAGRMLSLMEDLGYENVVNARSVRKAAELMEVEVVK